MIWLRSIAAVFVGILAVFVLSFGTDQILHQMQFYPPWNQGMHDPFESAVALFYRCAYTVLGGYIVAKFAPFRPIAHVFAFGAIVFVLMLLAFFSARNLNLVPTWYPLALVVTAIPCSWLGGIVQRRMLNRH